MPPSDATVKGPSVSVKALRDAFVSGAEYASCRIGASRFQEAASRYPDIEAGEPTDADLNRMIVRRWPGVVPDTARTMRAMLREAVAMWGGG